jgi:hypothetical protein
MPIPFLVGLGIGIGTGAVGIGKGVKAFFDNKKAGKLNVEAQDLIENGKIILEYARKTSGVSLECLGNKKVFLLDKSVKHFLKAFRKLKNVDFSASAGLNELNKFRMDKQSFTELRELSHFAASLTGGFFAGALGGALTAFGASGAVGLFATAGTGTAIASLSGAAATNATLAFLGGGTLAAGGMGIAGGTLVLGGLVAGPALAVMGFVIGAKASANLDRARSNYAEAEKLAEELGAASDLCKAIRRRSYLFTRLLIRLDVLFAPLVYQLERSIKKRGKDYRKFSVEEKKATAAALSIAAAVKAVLDTPILTQQGKLTKASRMIASDVRKQITVGEIVEDKNSTTNEDDSET